MRRVINQHLADQQYAQDMLEEAGCIRVCRDHGFLIMAGPIEDAFRHFEDVVASGPDLAVSTERYDSILDLMAVLYGEAVDSCPYCWPIGTKH